MSFGPHLVMDCSRVNRDKTSSLEVVSSFLSELPDMIGMHKIMEPYVFKYKGLVPEDKGVTGVVMVVESHIAFHSFIDKDYFFFDCFSCKAFNLDLVKSHVIKTFGVEVVHQQCFERGIDFPRYIASK